jgi:hypothetical protein
MIPTLSKRCKKTDEWILHPQAQEYVVVIPTKYKDRPGWADYVDRFIQVVKQTDKMHTGSVRAFVGLAQAARENPVSNRIDYIWLVNHLVDLDTYWTEYSTYMPGSRCAGGRLLIELNYLT